MYPQNQFLCFHFAHMEFFEEKTKTVFGTPFSHRKGRPFTSKLVVPPQNYFSLLFWKILFFLKKKQCQWKINIFKPSFPTKRLDWFLSLDAPLPLETAMSSHKWFFSFFRKCCVFRTASQHSLRFRLMSHEQ